MPEKVSFWARFKGWSGHLRHFNFLDLKEAELKSCNSCINQKNLPSSTATFSACTESVGMQTLCQDVKGGDAEADRQTEAEQYQNGKQNPEKRWISQCVLVSVLHEPVHEWFELF